MLMRQAERALFDLRRGLPVLLRDPDASTLVQAVEGLDDRALAYFQTLSGSPARLVLSGHRMAALHGTRTAEPASLLFSPIPDVQGLKNLAWTRGAQLPPTAAAHAIDRNGEAAVRLLRRAQLVPAAIVCTVSAAQEDAVGAEVANGNLLALDTGEALRLCEQGSATLTRISEARVPLAEAETSRFVLFREADGMREHVAIVIGDRAGWAQDVPVRLHSSCLTGDLFGSLKCDCGEQLRRGVAAISAQGGGILLYLSQEGRGIGLANKLRAYGLQDQGLDTIDADQTIGFSQDERDYRVAHEMLEQLGVARILLLTNNPTKVEALQRAGVKVVGRQAIYGEITEQNLRYLQTKAQRHGHYLHEFLNEQGEPASETPECLPAPDRPRG